MATADVHHTVLELDDAMPEYDFRERHEASVDAPAAAALAAASQVRVRDVPVFMALMTLRSLPSLITRRRGLRGDEPIVRGFERMGFAVVAHTDEELVVGGVGRFWRLDGGLRRIAPEDFAGFAEPGFVKAAVNFRVEPAAGGGSVLSTETRVTATDAEARRRFRPYWTLVRPGSGAIRRGWLRAARRRAEDGAALKPEPPPAPAP